MFYFKISHTDFRCLLDIKVLTQHAKGAGALNAYYSGKTSDMFKIIIYF